MHLMPMRSRRRATAGFSLIEVMVTLLVVSIGMLGLAKLQAAAVSEASLSRVRSLMTFQGESLASLMRGNRAFWATTTGTFPSFSVTSSGVVTYPSGTSGTATCVSTTGASAGCSPADMAGSDLTAWASSFTTQFSGASVSVACVGPGSPSTTCVTGGATPTAYDITLTWSEKSVAVNRSTLLSAADVSAAPAVTLVLHVQP
jgi:type IV pilus assembly protein PilV